jgi:hypothetical protein
MRLIAWWARWISRSTASFAATRIVTATALFSDVRRDVAMEPCGSPQWDSTSPTSSIYVIDTSSSCIDGTHRTALRQESISQSTFRRHAIEHEVKQQPNVSNMTPRPVTVPARALFSSQKILQNFSDFSSHRIFGHMYETLNIDKK